MKKHSLLTLILILFVCLCNAQAQPREVLIGTERGPEFTVEGGFIDEPWSGGMLVFSLWSFSFT